MKMDLAILCFCYACMTALIVLDLLYIFIKSKYISMYLICKTMFCMVEGVIPLIIHSKYYKFGTLYPWNIAIDYSESGIEALTVVCLFAFIGYLSMTFGYNNKYRVALGQRKIQILSNRNTQLKYDLILKYAAIVILVISIVSLFIWTKAYGGIVKFIMQANAIRSGFTNIHNSKGFFKHFAGAIMIPSYAFCILNIFTTKKKMTDIIMWIISFVFSVAFLLASDGRMTAGFYFIAYIAIYMQSKSRMIGKNISCKTILYVISCVGGALLLMLKMDEFTYYIRHGVWAEATSPKDNSMIDSLIFELSFVVRSEQVAVMKAKEVGFQLLNDIGYGIFAWLPSRFAVSSFPRLWTINSELGNMISGELPCGIVAQGYYDLRIIGIIAFTFIYGKMIRIMDEMDIKTPYGMTVYAALFYSIIRLVSYGMIYDFVQGMFDIFLFVIIYFILDQVLIAEKGSEGVC